MTSRSMHVRTKVLALLVSLVALWGFAAFVTARDGLNLLWVSTLDAKFGRPTDQLILALQTERRAAAVHLGGGSRGAAPATERARTDEAAARFRELAGSTDVRLAASSQAEQRVEETFAHLGELARIREAVDARRMDRAEVVTAYTDIIDAAFRIYGSLASLDDPEIAKDGRTLVSLTRAREVFAQEDALLAGALAARRLTATEHAMFVELVGTQRWLFAEADAELPPADHERYQQLLAGAAMTQVRSLEELVIKEGPGPAPISAASWDRAVEPAFVALRDLVIAGVDDVVARSTPAAAGVILRLVLAGGLGLIAVIASIVMSVTTARALVAQLEKLRNAAWDLATRRLPSVIDRLRRGEKVDVAAEAPPLEFGSDEIGQVSQAFNAVQQTAISSAVQQAELRDSVRDLFLGLARRNQALVHRQLRVLDAIERRETDPQELADIFRVDHLATRMRRNAENLIVLSGATPGRQWRNPVPMIDVLRGAVAEVEDYTRVTVTPVEGVWLAGRAVSDVIHLVAELIENATSFSPPYTPVRVAGQLVANGFVIEVEDRGLGMIETEQAEANELIRNPPDFNLSSTARLGLYVVGRLAQRHEIDVRLRRSPYGGTTAIVLVPRTLVVGGPGPTAPSADGRGDGGAPGGTAGGPGAPSAAPEAAPRERPDVAAPFRPVPVAAARTAGERRERMPRDRREQMPGERWERVPGEQRERMPGERPERAPVAAVPPPTEAVAPDAPANSASGTPGGPGPTVEGMRTPSGLPWRVRQASLAPGLRDGGPPPHETADEITRSPERTRQMMSAYQQASLRGRTDADRALTEAGDESPSADVPTDRDAAEEHDTDQHSGKSAPADDR